MKRVWKAEKEKWKETDCLSEGCALRKSKVDGAMMCQIVYRLTHISKTTE